MSESNTAFVTVEECADLASVMGRKYASFLNDRAFDIQLSKDGFGVQATVTLANKSGSFHYPVEGRLSHRDHDMTARDAALFLLDYIDSYYEEYFQTGGDCFLPIDWSDYDADGVPLQLKGQILNLEVDRMADEFLKKADLNLN